MTQTQLDILTVLTFKCSVATVIQLHDIVSRCVNDAGSDDIEQALSELTARSLLDVYSALAHPLLELEAPLVRWTPADASPQFTRVAWQLRRRWSQAPICIRAVVATPKARRMVGGVCGGKRPALRDLSHHLHLTQVYANYHRRTPAALWQHEQELESLGWLTHHSRLPDAVVDGVAIDVGGKYSATKLRDVHHFYQSIQKTYEVW